MPDGTRARYSGDAGPGAWLRLALVAGLLGFAAALVLEGVLELISLLFGIPKDALARAKASVGKIGDFIPLPPLTLKSILPSGLLLTLAAVRLARRLDFFLFSTYDLRLLRPVTRYTGIFCWVLPETGGIRKAWDELSNWALKGVGEGRWHLSWHWRQPSGFVPFAWTALLGPSGVGKSQLAKELARHLALRKQRGDSERKPGPMALLRVGASILVDWVRRVVPFLTTIDRPWDVGLIASNDSEDTRFDTLSEWRPRKPTLILLDDPGVGVTATIVRRLQGNASRFWFPVRLVVIDHFVGADWPLNPNVTGVGWHYAADPDSDVSPAFLSEQFNSNMFQAAAHRFWTQPLGMAPQLKSGSEMPALFGRSDCDRLVAAVEGSPLLLALAVLWLDERPQQGPPRYIGDLVNQDLLRGEETLLFDGENGTLKELVAHRLLRARVGELYDTYRDFDQSHATVLRKVLGCATLAGKIDLAWAKQRFGMDIDQTHLRRLFPLAQIDSGLVESIPPVEPWLMGETFLMTLLRESYANDLQPFVEEIVVPGLGRSPDRVGKIIERGGRIAEIVATVVEGSSSSDDSAWQLIRFGTFASQASQDFAAKSEPALTLARSLPIEHVEEALTILARLQTRGKGDPMVIGALYFTLAGRVLARGPGTALAYERALEWLERWSLGVNQVSVIATGLPCRRDELLSSFRVFADGLLRLAMARSSRLERFAALLDLNDVVHKLPWTLNEPLVAAAEEHCGTESEWALVWSVRRYAQSGDWTAAEQGVARLEAVTSDGRCSASESASLLVWAWSYVAAARRDSQEGGSLVEAAAMRADGVAAGVAGNTLAHPTIAEARAWAWGDVASAHGVLSEERTRVEADANRVDEISAAFIATPLAHPRMAQARAWAWVYVAYARSVVGRERRQTEVAARKVDDICAPFLERPVAYPEVIRAAAWAWAHVAHARSEIPEERRQTTAAARRVDEIVVALQENPVGYPEATRARAAAWKSVAYARSVTPEERGQTEAAARKVDEIVAPFAHNPIAYARIMGLRAEAWKHVAYARSLTPEERNQTEAAARKVDQIGVPFATEPLSEIRGARAQAWKSVAYARSLTLTDRRGTESAARKVDEIVAPFAQNLVAYPDAAVAHAEAWGYVAYARSLTPEERDQTEAAARRVEEIGGPFATAPLMYPKIMAAVAWAWTHVAHARAQVPERRRTAEAAARQVDETYSPFGASPFAYPDIVTARAWAWMYVAYARSQTQDERGETEAAARQVDEITAPFMHDLSWHPLLIEARTEAWRYAALVRGS